MQPSTRCFPSSSHPPFRFSLPRLFRALTSAAVVAGLVASLTACGGGGGGGGNGGAGGGPTAPPTPFAFAGTYTGSMGWSRPGTPIDHCLARWLEDEAAASSGHGFAVQVTLQENDGAVTGTVRGMDLPTSCALRGSLDELGSVRWHQTTCDQPCARFAHPRLSCPELRICLVARDVEARFSSATGSIEGAQTVVWAATEMASGTARGQVTFEGPVDLRP